MPLLLMVELHPSIVFRQLVGTVVVVMELVLMEVPLEAEAVVEELPIHMVV